MRPAPRTEPGPHEHAREPDDVQLTRSEKGAAANQRRRKFVALVAVAAVAIAAAGVGGWALITRSSTTPGAPGAPAASPARPPFFFRIGKVTADATGRKVPGVAGDAAVEIAGDLGAFYDTVFMNPDTWKGGVPDGAWDVFDDSVRDRAMQDGEAFTLGPQAANLKSLRVENGVISVEVLVDPKGNAQAAVAHIEFKARGTLVGGQTVTVVNTASLLLQVERGSWVVFGYPEAKTTIEAQPLSPSGSPSAGATQSSSPTGGASP